MQILGCVKMLMSQGRFLIRAGGGVLGRSRLLRRRCSRCRWACTLRRRARRPGSGPGRRGCAGSSARLCRNGDWLIQVCLFRIWYPKCSKKGVIKDNLGIWAVQISANFVLMSHLKDSHEINQSRQVFHSALAVPQMSSNSPWGSLPELYTLMEPSCNVLQIS